MRDSSERRSRSYGDRSYGDRSYGERSYGDRGGGGGFARRSFAPVKVGDELEVTIEAVGAKGDGVAKKDGFVLFVPNAKQGETVKIKVTRVLRKVGFAEIVGQGQSSSESEQSSENQESSEESYSSEESSGSSEESSGDEEQYDASQDVEDFGEESK